MVKLITTVALVLVSFVATAQSQFEKGMGSALKLWGEGKNTEAIAQFERIASVEKTNWLPNYYIAAINTFQAFGEKDKTKMKTLFELCAVILMTVASIFFLRFSQKKKLKMRNPAQQNDVQRIK